jgi:DNA-binding PadR family transcriptional regulator
MVESRADNESLKELTTPMFQLLVALAEGDLHGYAILKRVALQTDGKIHLSTGTLYNVIKRLLNAGMIAELRERPAPELDDQRRRYYRLTDWGRQVAIAEAERMQRSVELAHARLLLPGPETA